MQIGIDLGGTKIEGIALDHAGRELARLRVPTPRAYDETIAAIVSLVTQLETRTGERGTVGIGIPGAVVPDTGLVKNANSVWLIGQPLGADLAVRLGREIRLDNDANCFALSEASDGAAAGAEVVFGVIMGTGVGGGIIAAPVAGWATRHLPLRLLTWIVGGLVVGLAAWQGVDLLF